MSHLKLVKTPGERPTNEYSVNLTEDQLFILTLVMELGAVKFEEMRSQPERLNKYIKKVEEVHGKKFEGDASSSIDPLGFIFDKISDVWCLNDLPVTDAVKEGNEYGR